MIKTQSYSTNPAKLKMQQHRKQKNRLALGLSITGMLIGLFWLTWIMLTIIYKGMNGISWSFFTEITPSANSQGGGMMNAIVGSFLIIFYSSLIGTPLGVLAGIYVAEYKKHPKLRTSIRFINDILLSAPSIVIGLFIYAIVVVKMGNFSGYAGVLALTILQIPIIIKTTENMLKLIPNELREAAYALGTPKWKIIYTISLKAALPGILTGILLAIARISGETAPLLFTTLSNQFFSLDLSKPIANLPVAIYNFASQPDTNLQNLAWAGILFITLFILFLSIAARILFRQRK